MKRREFITLLGGAAAWPLAARAQQPRKVWRLLWTLAFGQYEDCTPTHDYEAIRQPAMAAFAKSSRAEMMH